MHGEDNIKKMSICFNYDKHCMIYRDSVLDIKCVLQFSVQLVFETFFTVVILSELYSRIVTYKFLTVVSHE